VCCGGNGNSKSHQKNRDNRDKSDNKEYSKGDKDHHHKERECKCIEANIEVQKILLGSRILLEVDSLSASYIYEIILTINQTIDTEISKLQIVYSVGQLF